MSDLDEAVAHIERAIPPNEAFAELRSEVVQAIASSDAGDEADSQRSRLVLGLYTSLFANPPDINQRQRYFQAILHICDSLMDQGIPTLIVEELLELGKALKELDNNMVRPFLDVKRKPGNQADPALTWFCRALIASAFSFLIEDIGLNKRKAAKRVTDSYRSFGLVVAHRGNFGTALLKWHQDFEANLVADRNAQSAYSRRAMLIQGFKENGLEGFQIADAIMSEALLTATRISDDAKSLLANDVAKLKR